ncbi:hypothetical protein KAI32_01030 [Candidatus Pacearchaeota archaeon]|nr:hypothetical protein [Candidatus Pacearchaeota archaeon]
MKCFEKMVKKLDVLDIGLIKWSVAAFVLFVITIWPAAMTWVHSVNPWYFLIASVVFAIRPCYKAYLK